MPVSHRITSNSFWPMVVAIARPMWDAARARAVISNLGARLRAERAALLGLLRTRVVVRFLETGFSGQFPYKGLGDCIP